MHVPRRLTINRNCPRYHGLDMKKLVASMPMTINFGGKMSVISKWMCELTEWMETVSRGMVDTERRITKLDATVAEQTKRIDALETEGVFGKGVLTRLTKLEDWRQDCSGDPFGKFADGYPPVGHPDRSDTQTPEPDCATCVSFWSDDDAEPCLSCINNIGKKNNWTPNPSHAADLMAGVKSAQAVAANLTKPSQPELVEGWWYVDKYSGKPVRLEKCSQIDKFLSLYRPATLDDLAHEVDGVKVWMVEEDESITLYCDARIAGGYYPVEEWVNDEVMRKDYRNIAREYAALAHIPIITEAEWELLTKEAGK